MDLRDVPAIVPESFFTVECEIQKGLLLSRADPYLLPQFGELLGEEPFADVSMTWNEEGLFFAFYVDVPFVDCSYPGFEKGDSIELFIDTKDNKKASFTSRFCHHFVFLPKEQAGITGAEVTKFRTEDKHDLCDFQDLSAKTTFSKNSYEMQIDLPENLLHGFDPDINKSIGFTYRINRTNGASQHFSIGSDFIKIENHPSFWASLMLR